VSALQESRDPTQGGRLMESILLGLEPRLRELSERGGEFQGQVESLTKSETGSPGADLVSQADYWVQREMLNLFLENGLADCQLVAEESSAELVPIMERFAAESEYQLFLDPIDGTRRFLEGLPFFSTIVTLRHRHQSLYTFCYYPKLHWWIRLLGDSSWEISGRLPLSLPTQPRCVVYTSGSPGEDFGDWQEQLGDWTWLHGDEVHPCGSKLLYLSGSVAGYACAKPNLYDGLMIYHYAKVRKHQIKEFGSSSTAFDLGTWCDGPRGMFVPGRYLCIQSGSSS